MALSLMIDVFVVATVYLWFLYPHVPGNGRFDTLLYICPLLGLQSS